MYYLVLDFGGSSVKCAVMTEDAHIVERFSVNSKAETYTQWIDRFVPIFECCDDKYIIEGIAISTCGAVDVESGVIHGSSALPYIHGFDVRTIYHSKFHVPVELENDACCAALAESWLGEGNRSEHFCTLVIGSGIGGAIVTNKNIQKGYNLHGGEFGFSIAEFQNGKPVIWGQVASTQALVSKAAKALNIPVNSLNGMDVFKKYDEKNEIILQVVDDWLLKLATGIFNIQYHVDPEMIVLGGAISKREGFVEQINLKLDLLFGDLPIAKVRPVITASRFGNDVNLIGALRHYLNRQGM